MIDILMIHPDEKLLGLYKQRLSSGFTVDSARDGLTGLRKINMLMPSLVVSDYDLPFLSGHMLLKYVRAHRSLHSIPFIFLSNEPFVHEVMDHAASDWLHTKNLSPEYVVAKIQEHFFTNKNLIKVTKYV